MCHSILQVETCDEILIWMIAETLAVSLKTSARLFHLIGSSANTTAVHVQERNPESVNIDKLSFSYIVSS